MAAPLTCTTAGESHGSGVCALVTGMPAGLDWAAARDRIDRMLTRRQGGLGRSGRQRIESDSVEALSGVRRERTTGAPILLRVANRDDRLDTAPEVTRPRPGHADLAGMMKFHLDSARDVLERASARETAARTAAGGLAAALLEEVGAVAVGYVVAIGAEAVSTETLESLEDLPIHELRDRVVGDPAHCPDPDAAERMAQAVEAARRAGDTLGGVVEVRIRGLAPGLGGLGDAAERLDARLCGALASIQAVKGAEVGLGFRAADRPGSAVHDAIERDPEAAEHRRQARAPRGPGGDEPHPRTPKTAFIRRSNRAGGLEGGLTNGEDVVVRAAMKPLSTLRRPMASVDTATGEAADAAVERSDVCAVGALSVVAEAVCAFEAARALLLKTGGDTLEEVLAAHDRHLEAIRRF